MKSDNLKAAAILTIFRAADMSLSGRKKIASWLRREAKRLESTKYSKQMAGRYTARWVYKP